MEGNISKSYNKNTFLDKKFVAYQYSREKEYWLNKLSGDINQTSFPYDYDSYGSLDRNIKENRKTETFKWENELFAGLIKLRNGDDKNLLIILISSLVALHYKYNGQENIVVGTPVLKQKIDANLINTQLVIRNQLNDRIPFKNLLMQTREILSEAFQNQNYPLELLVNQLQYTKKQGENSFFDVALLLKNIQCKSYLPHPFPSVIFSFKRLTNSIEGQVDYSCLLYERETIKRWRLHLENLLRESILNLELAIPKIEILGESEKEQIIYQFNSTSVTTPEDKTIHQLFEIQAKKSPHYTAVVNNDLAISYRKLNQMANQMANFLNSHCEIKPEDRVGIVLERSQKVLEVILGILKAGGVFVPILPDFPEKRIKLIINDSRISFIITQEKYFELFSRLQWECKSFKGFLCIDGGNLSSTESYKLMDSNEELWDFIAESGNDEITSGGWQSSYTGESFSKKEMEEFRQNIYKKLLPLLNKEKRVLDIGCASGLTMFQLAPHVDHYHGTDLSAAMIQMNQNLILEKGINNILLSHLPAHEIDRIDKKNFDMVIMNSVIQYFEGYSYLRFVLRKAIDSLALHGFIFIGDILDHDLKDNLVYELIEFKKENQGNNYNTKIDWSSELFVSRRFWEDLCIEFPEIVEVQVSDKIHTIKNELTKFRYDILLTIDKSNTEKNSQQRKYKYQYDYSMLNQCEEKKVLSKSLEVLPHHLAYVMYTSGSTGKPKGVMIQHESIVNLVTAMVSQIAFQKDKSILAFTTTTFDMSIIELLIPLTQAMKIVIADDNQQKDLVVLHKFIIKHQIQMIQLTPSVLQTTINLGNFYNSFKNVKELIVGGEAYTQSLNSQLRSSYHGKLYNIYGPTEITVYALLKELKKPDISQITIGKPMANTQVYILNKWNQPQSIGIVGELCISGMGLSRGYLNRPELTAEKFCLLSLGGCTKLGNLFLKKDSSTSKKFLNKQKILRGVQGGSFLEKSPHACWRQRLYRTGDLAKWLENGEIQLLGRMDHQVKLRGFRIELEEIEKQLMSYELIKESLVILRSNQSGDESLCAYVVLKKSVEDIDVLELKEFLAKDLPEYMIPSKIVILNEFPISINGKVDHQALPEPEKNPINDHIAPRNKVEEKLVEIWSDVLGINPDELSIDANFFNKGGHSLKATIMVSMIHKEFNVSIPLNKFFNNPTIGGISESLKNARVIVHKKMNPIEKKEYYNLSSAQKRLYFLQNFDLDSTAYNMPYCFNLTKDLKGDDLKKIFLELIYRHESLRSSFHMINDEPAQRIHENVELKVNELEKEIGQEEGGELISELHKAFICPFDLEEAPLFRISSVKSCGSQIIFLDMHHIISDGTSIEILRKEFFSLLLGEEIPILKIQYKDFIEWQKRMEYQKLLKKQERYWLGKFQGNLPKFNIPTDFSRPVVQNFEGNTINFELSIPISQKLRKISKAQNNTMFITILTIFNVFLSKISKQHEITIGVPIACRRFIESYNIIGFFVNTLVLRCFPCGEKFFNEFLSEVKSNTIEAFDNQEYPFDELVERLLKQREPGRNPLFDVMFAFHNQTDFSHYGHNEQIDPFDDESISFDRSRSLFDLILHGYEGDDHLFFLFEYNIKLFKKETIELFIRFFKEIVEIIFENDQIRLEQIKFYSDLIHPKLNLPDFDLDI